MIVLYFIRFKVGGNKYIVIVQDGKQRLRLNSFISELFIHINNPYGSENALMEMAEKDGMITFLEMQLAEIKEQETSREQEFFTLKSELQELRRKAATWDLERQRLIESDEVKKLWQNAATEEVEGLKEEAAKVPLLMAEIEKRDQQIAALKMVQQPAPTAVDNYEIANKDRQIAALTAELNELKAHPSAAADADLRRQLEAISFEKSISDEKLLSKNDQIMSLTKEAERLAHSNMDMQLRLDSTLSDRTLIESDLKVARQQLEILTVDKESIAEKAQLLEKNTEILTEELRTALEQNKSVATEYEHVKVVLQEQQDLNAKIDQQYKEVLQNIEDQKSLIREKEEELSGLMGKVGELDESLKTQTEQFERISTELTQAEKACEEQRSKVDVLTQEVEKSSIEVKELSRRSGELTGLNNILRKSRDKFSELVNGVEYPIFTVDEAGLVITSNKAFIKMCGKRSVVEVAGKPCYTMVKQPEQCRWCARDTVREQKTPVRVSVSTGQDSNVRHLDITFLPIMDPDGNVIEIAEIIDDNTENVELMGSVSKFKEKLRDFKKARIEDMNDMDGLKRAYISLSNAHDTLLGKNNKMLRVIERLATEDKARELLSTRTDLLEVRNKLLRATEMIKNYKYQLDEQTLRYSDLNRRTFMQMEKLLNLIKNKHQMRNDDSMAVLSFLTKEFEHVRKHFIEAKKKEEKDPALEALKERVKSSEEKALRAKLGSKKEKKDDVESK
jgi:PAS domain-containing protein